LLHISNSVGSRRLPRFPHGSSSRWGTEIETAKTTYKLTAKQIVSLPPGKHSDGGDLYVGVREGGSWQFVAFYRAGAKRREVGLGGAGAGGISLAEARQSGGDASGNQEGS
jgi:hypothetical protein